MSWMDEVVAAAKTLSLIDESNQLVPLDSLSVLDLITEIENRTSISISTADIRAENFESLESVANLLSSLAPAT